MKSALKQNRLTSESSIFYFPPFFKLSVAQDVYTFPLIFCHFYLKQTKTENQLKLLQ